MLSVVILAIPLAWVLFTVIELPFIEMGRRLTAKGAMLEAMKHDPS